MNWTVYWARLPEAEKDSLRAIGKKYRGIGPECAGLR